MKCVLAVCVHNHPIESGNVASATQCIFGTLGHGRHGRYCVGLEIDALACFEKWKIRYDGERVLCNSAIVALMGEKKISNSVFFFFFCFPVWKQHLGSQVTLSELTKHRMAWVATVRMKTSPSTTFPDTCLFVHGIFTKVSSRVHTYI